MLIIGVNAYHGDSSACLLKDGKIITAVEEERFRRVKHWAGFPSESIKFCLSANNLSLNDIDYVAINHNSKVHKFKKISYALSQFSIPFVLSHLKNLNIKHSFEDEFIKKIGTKSSQEFVHIEHHLAHLASAFYASGLDDAVAISIDGFGDFSSASWGSANWQQTNALPINIDNYINFPHSLGIFYQAMTQYLGFKHYGDEYKIMGMAAYGKPVYLDRLLKVININGGHYKLNLKYFTHHKGKAKYRWQNGVPECDDLFSQTFVDYFYDVLGNPREEGQPIEQTHKDFAASVQAVYEQAFFALLNKLYLLYKNSNLVLSGGCAMNSLANGKIADQTPFKNIYIPPAAGDAGGAVGAAYVAWNMQQNDKPVNRKDSVMEHAFLGPKFSRDDYMTVLENIKKDAENKFDVQELEDEKLFHFVTEKIIQGGIIGWFDDEMEWGPRALGHRSIIADPRKSNIREILNIKIKLRESFRPFAPSVLEEHSSQWFEKAEKVPFMSQVFNIKKEKRRLIPAVTHVDGTGRLQTVGKMTNPRYYGLIEAFYKKTSIPMLINTSFNENEPIVCQPKEALDCFLRTKMDVLVLGNLVIIRQTAREN